MDSIKLEAKICMSPGCAYNKITIYSGTFCTNCGIILVAAPTCNKCNAVLTSTEDNFCGECGRPTK